MALATLQNIIDFNGLSYEVAEKVQPYLYEASEKIREWIGDQKYEDMVSAGTAAAFLTAESNRQYADTEFSNTQRAEAILAFAYALPRLNMRLSEKGGLLKATGFAESINQIMGKRELDAYAHEIIARARLLMREMIYHGYISREDRSGETFVL